jgi:hypothetical protein
MLLTSEVVFGQLIDYDSASNCLGEDIKKYIEQELYLKSVSEILREYGYQGLYIDHKKGNAENTKNNIYKRCGDDTFPPYEINVILLQNKISDMLIQNKQNKTSDMLIHNKTSDIAPQNKVIDILPYKKEVK